MKAIWNSMDLNTVNIQIRHGHLKTKTDYRTENQMAVPEINHVNTRLVQYVLGRSL
jgi:hypothetical protein